MRNKPIAYVEDSTLTALVPSLCVRVAIVKFVNRDIGKISEYNNDNNIFYCNKIAKYNWKINKLQMAWLTGWLVIW